MSTVAASKLPLASPSPHGANLGNSYGSYGVVERGPPTPEGGVSGGYSLGSAAPAQNLSRAVSNSSSAANNGAGGAVVTNGYFPNCNYQQQQQQQYLQTPQDQEQQHPDDVTVLNTHTNSQFQSYPQQPQSHPFTSSNADGAVAAPSTSTAVQRPAKFTEEWDASQRGSSIIDGPNIMHRSNSFSGSTTGERADGPPHTQLSRGNTLKKKPSLRRGGSLKRSGSRRSMKAGSVRSLALQSATDEDEMHSAFFCPVPTNGNPTEALANRFQAWRKILKDLIAYFREIQTHYEHRSKSLLKLANVLNNTTTPPGFLTSGGLDDALDILRNYNKQAIQEANKARDIEEDVILALTGLRSDLQMKIKEIKNLAGDFKNTVDKEMDITRRAVKNLQEILGKSEIDSSTTTGKQDPYLLRLAVDRQLERQIDEENYLHRAYLNLENSGRELESIVVGEVQKAYNAYAGILKREADSAYNTVDELRGGPIAMPKDHEWSQFVQRDDKFVNPEIPPRSAQQIHYPGRDHFACQEIRAGLLERKSKYLKSYTAGWYVLSPTHLHEFKTADKTQAPVMSLYLPEQKLGSHSAEGSSSNKFILKGRQTGAMHRGHTWVFRAESHDTMMAWYEDIKALTEKSPEERSNFVRGHSRSYSRASQRSISSDGMVVDEEDDEPFAPDSAAIKQSQKQDDILPRRPSPGGRFPSDITVNAERGLQVPLSPSSVNSGFVPTGAAATGSATLNPKSSGNENQDRDVIAAATALPGGGHLGQYSNNNNNSQGDHLGYGSTIRTPMIEATSHAAMVRKEAQEDGVNPYTSEPIASNRNSAINEGVYRDGVFYPVAASPQPQQHQGQQPGVDVRVSRGLSTNSQSVAASPTPAVGGNPGSSGRDSDAFLVNAYSASGQQQQPRTISPQHPLSSRTSSEIDLDAETPMSDARSPGLDMTNGYTTASGGGSRNVRPVSQNLRSDSVPTVSNLHIPGGYPKSTPTLQ